MAKQAEKTKVPLKIDSEGTDGLQVGPEDVSRAMIDLGPPISYFLMC